MQHGLRVLLMYIRLYWLLTIRVLVLLACTAVCVFLTCIQVRTRILYLYTTVLILIVHASSTRIYVCLLYYNKYLPRYTRYSTSTCQQYSYYVSFIPDIQYQIAAYAATYHIIAGTIPATAVHIYYTSSSYTRSVYQHITRRSHTATHHTSYVYDSGRKCKM